VLEAKSTDLTKDRPLFVGCMSYLPLILDEIIGSVYVLFCGAMVNELDLATSSKGLGDLFWLPCNSL
jgi:hypothetical protein